MRQTLTKEGKEIFPYLSEFSDFYLAGGTALALQIGHRISVDFDLFSEKEIPPNLIGKVENIFNKWEISPSVKTKEELTVFINGVKVTFLKYPFPVVLPMEEIGGLRLLRTKEIAAAKAYTLGRRVTYKDYVDLYFILKESYVSIGEIIEIADRKYGNEFNGRLFLEQLLYLDDVPEDDIIFLKNKVSKSEIKIFLEAQIKEYKI